MIKSNSSIFFFLIISVFAFGQNQKRIHRIESTILPSIIIKGTDYEKTTIEEVMKQEKVPGLSIAFVDNGKIA
jgi:bifunctional ADP-heptose synthase (sugar kinase/adenylyltransferase)